jgi:hypothetical protein
LRTVRKLQQRTGLFADVVTCGYTLTCLTSRDFWRDEICPWLLQTQHDLLRLVSARLADQKELPGLTAEQAGIVADPPTCPDAPSRGVSDAGVTARG